MIDMRLLASASVPIVAVVLQACGQAQVDACVAEGAALAGSRACN